jgi:hypothetical protein
MTLSKTVLAVGVAAALSAGSALAAGTGVDFKVQEGVVAGASPNLLTADSFNFDYSATINQTLVGATYNGNDPFTEIGNLSVSAYTLNNSSVPSQVNGFGAAGYGIVGDFNASGFTQTFGAGLKAIFDTFNLNLRLDADQNGIGETLLGTASIYAYSEANITGGLANGDYDVILLFTPTAFGSTYFVDPVPFLLQMEVTGVTTTITGVPPLLNSSFVAAANGSGNAFVNPIPEPGTLVLSALGLLGLGGSLRRKKSS